MKGCTLRECKPHRKRGRALQGSLGPNMRSPAPQHINQEPDEIPFEIPQKISADFGGVWIRLQIQNKS